MYICIRVLGEISLFPYTSHLSIHSCLCLFCRSLLQVSFDTYVRLFNRSLFICIRVLGEISLLFHILQLHTSLSIHVYASFAGLFCRSLLQVSFASPFAYKYNPFVVCFIYIPLFRHTRCRTHEGPPFSRVTPT